MTRWQRIKDVAWTIAIAPAILLVLAVRARRDRTATIHARSGKGERT